MSSSDAIEKLLREGRPADALAAADEVVARYRSDQAVPRDLAHVEKVRGDALRALERTVEAVEADTRARDRLHIFALVDASGLGMPRPSAPLVRVRLDLGSALYDTRQYDAALVETAAALEAARALPSERALLAEAQVAHGTMMVRGLSEEDEVEMAAALRLQLDGIATYRALAKESPARYIARLAHALRGLGLTRSTIEDLEGASIAYEESASLFRGLEAARPGTYHLPLADVLVRLARVLGVRHRHEEALGRADEAIALLRTRDAASRGLVDAIALRAELVVLRGRS